MQNVRRLSYIFVLVCMVFAVWFFVQRDKPESPDWSLVTPLHEAAETNDFDTVVALIEDGAPINAKTRIGDTALSFSLRHDDLEIARYLIENGANLKQPRLLHSTIFYGGSTDAVLLLLAEGVDPRWDNGRSTGLHAFSFNGNLDMLEALLDAGADVNAKDVHGRTPIFSALPLADPSIVRRMIAAGADMTIEDNSGLTALQRVAMFDYRSGENIVLTVAAGANPDKRDAQGRTPLHHAARRGSPENIRALVQSGGHIEALDIDGTTPLLTALREGRLKTVDELVSLGANVEAIGFKGRTALFYASSSENPEVMALILSQNPVIDQRDADNATPLMLASATGPAELVTLLIDAGASVDARDDFDQTPLDYAARFADGSVVRTLIARGADPNAVNSDGRRPWVLGFNNRRLRADAGAFNLLAVSEDDDPGATR